MECNCYQLCLEGDPESAQTTERWKYVGQGRGSYNEQSKLEYVGEGKGNIDLEKTKTYGELRLATCCMGICAVSALALLGVFLWLYLNTESHPPIVGAAEPYNCYKDFHDWQNLWGEDQRRYCCSAYQRACQDETEFVVHKVYQPVRVPSVPRVHYVPVPSPPHVVYKTRVHYLKPKVIYKKRGDVFTYDCDEGYPNWFFGWSGHKKSWCCDHMNMGCPGTWHGSHHLHSHVFAKGVGHAHGRIYDCDAGFSNWMQGWSDSKKDWCCSKRDRGCVKFHCTSGADHAWGEEKRSWHGNSSKHFRQCRQNKWRPRGSFPVRCCSNFQKGCPHTTLSALKCNTPCTLAGETSTCLKRIQWVSKNAFSGKGDACNLAYSKVQVECDVCRACSIQEAGCHVHSGGHDPFDCNAALNNFFRAWSPSKKHWCCTQRGKGCEGSSPPAVDAGFGMVWKHVQVNGYWTWQAVHAAGGIHTKLPYDCHAGRHNWHIGWSAPKKAWCCSNQQLGCEGAGGGGGGGAAGGSFHSSSWHSSGGGFHSGGSYHTHVIHHYH